MSYDVEAHRKCITATDLAAISGLSPFQKPIDVYMFKCGLTDGAVENEAMEWGARLEDKIAAKCAEKHDWKLFKPDPPLIMHPFHEWMGASPDYLVETKPEIIVECKNVGQSQKKYWGEAGSDDIPEYYQTQVHWQMMVVSAYNKARGIADVEYCIVAVLFGGREYREYRINRNVTIEKALFDRAQAFWFDHVCAQIPPPLDGSEGSEKFLALKFPSHNDDMLTSTEQIDVIAHELLLVKGNIREEEDRKDALEVALKEIIGASAGVVGRDYRATWKRQKDGEKLDMKALRGALAADMIRAHTVARPGVRVFKITETEEE